MDGSEATTTAGPAVTPLWRDRGVGSVRHRSDVRSAAVRRMSGRAVSGWMRRGCCRERRRRAIQLLDRAGEQAPASAL